MFGLICVQTVCKGCQQTTLVGKELKKDESDVRTQIKYLNKATAGPRRAVGNLSCNRCVSGR